MDTLRAGKAPSDARFDDAGLPTKSLTSLSRAERSDGMRSRADTHGRDDFAALLAARMPSSPIAKAADVPFGDLAEGPLLRVHGRAEELGASAAASALLAKAKDALDGASSLSQSTIVEACDAELEAAPHAVQLKEPNKSRTASILVRRLLAVLADVPASCEPAEALSSNPCTDFVLLKYDEIIASSNSCTAFVMLQDGAVVASSNPCAAFVVCIGGLLTSSNPCSAFTVGCPLAVSESKSKPDADPTPAGLRITFAPKAPAACAEHELPYEPEVRFRALNKQLKQPRGAKSLEHELNLRQSCPTLGNLSPRVDRPSSHEITYDPLARFTILGKQLKQPRGAKSLEHELNLRQSCPTLGNLSPRVDRPSSHEITYDPVARFAVLGKQLEQPRGAKSLEHELNLRQSCPTLGNLSPRVDRPSSHEITYDPVARFTVLGKQLKQPRGAKSLEHELNLRQSCPTLGNLSPRVDRPSSHEITYDPVARFTVLGKQLKQPRGAKSLEHELNLRQSCPTLGNLSPRVDRPSSHEITYDPVARFTVLGKQLKQPRGAKSLEHELNLRQSCPTLGNLSPRVDRPSSHEITYDPVARFAVLGKQLKQPRGAKSLEHELNLRQSCPTLGNLSPRVDRPSSHEITYDPVARFTVLGKQLEQPRGAKSLEHELNSRQSCPTLGNLSPRVDRPSSHEITYDPLARFTILGKQLKQPRGAKSLEHELNLRQSCPTLGNLSPRVDRPSSHEITYDPVARFTVLGKQLKQPRGAKSLEHELNLRQSCPTLGNLSPRVDRPSSHEITYDPVARFTVLGKQLEQPRGAKSLEHELNSRQSCPTLGNLSPRVDRPSSHEITYDPVARFAILGKQLEQPRGAKSLEHELNLRQSCPTLGNLSPRVDRPSSHEITYDPLARFTILGKQLKQPRGAKSLEHELNLRQSCPTLGNLSPRVDRPSSHEITYDPLARFTVLGKQLKQPRGAKSLEHELNLRQSCPTLGNLSPRVDRPSSHEITYDPVARFMALAKLLAKPHRGEKRVEHLRNLRASCPTRQSSGRPSDLFVQTEDDFVLQHALAAASSVTSSGMSWRSQTSCTTTTSAARRVSFDEGNLSQIAGMLAERPSPIKAPESHRPARRQRTSAKKTKSPKISAARSPKLSPRLSPKGKSPRASPKASKSISPGLRHATAALLLDALELPTAYVKNVKRAELEIMSRPQASSRCARYTLAANRMPQLFVHQRRVR